MYIDYSNVEKPPAERAIPAAQSAGANVVVLSADPVLIDLARDSLAGSHRVWRADDANHAADLVVAAGTAVLLADAALADHDTREFVTRINAQFPELAIIVAGRRDDEAELAELISKGVVFRFLHMPASAERIRNFVEATLRRKQKPGDTAGAPARQADASSTRLKRPALPAVQLDRTTLGRWSRRSLLLIPLGLVIMLLASWKPWERLGELIPETGRDQPTTAHADRQAELRALLDAAGLALSQGQLVEPPERNALELYRAVLARDPGNRTAERGIDRVADELLSQAEQALIAEDLVALASALDAARSARPDHQRLEFFTIQLERARLADSGKARRPAGESRQAGTPPGQSGPASATSRVQGLVLLANERIHSNRLVGSGDSAHAYLVAARRIDPAHAGVQQGITALTSLLQANARRAMSEGRLDEAGEWVRQAVALDAERPEVSQLRSELEIARLGTLREDRARLLSLSNQRLTQGRLIEPVADSARHYLDLLRASDPAYPGLAEASALLAGRTLAEARRLAAAGNVAAAEVMLRAANDAGAPATEVAAAATEIARARAALSPPKPVVPAVLPESALIRTHFVNPVYPPRALERGISGWVDVEFTVARDGSTLDAIIMAAEPTGVFDRAALESVARWRYEPRVVNGVIVEQRVATRLRFQLAD
ncbi:MAG: energy transducer TonB [Steroidobacteraceae bacterium]